MPFSHDIAGGNGNLVASQIQSPNYNPEAGTGWRIAKDGTATFYAVNLPGFKSGTKVTFSSTAPAGPATGDLWYDTANGLLVSQYNGTTWVPYQIGTNALAAGSVTSANLGPASVSSESLIEGALDNAVVSQMTMNGGTISAADFIIAPGANNGVFAYGTPPDTTYNVSAVGAGTWTCPPNVTSITLEMWSGGGGAGGGCWYQEMNNTTGMWIADFMRGGGGGAGGNYAKWTVPVTPGTTYSFNVGSGGTGGSGGWNDTSTGYLPTNGANGGNSTFTAGSTTYTVYGGGGGKAGSTDGKTMNGGQGGVRGAAASPAPAVSYLGGAGGATVYANGGGGGSSAGDSANGNPGGAATSSTYGVGGAAVGNGGGGAQGEAGGQGVWSGGQPGGGGGGGEGYLHTTDSQGDIGTDISDGGGDGGQGKLKLTYSVSSGRPQVLSSMTALPGTDPYGSTVQDGFTSYAGSASMQMHVNQGLAVPAIEMYSGAASEEAHASIATYGVNLGANNEFMNTVITGPASTYDSVDTQIFLISRGKDGSNDPAITLNVGGNRQMYVDGAGAHFQTPVYGMNGQLIVGDKLVPPVPGTTATAESWHLLAVTLSGWANTSGGTPLQYRMLASPPNTVQIMGDISGTAISASPVTIATLPPAYVYAGVWSAPQPLAVAGGTLTTPGTPPFFQVDGSGGIRIYNGKGATRFSFNALVSIDGIVA